VQALKFEALEESLELSGETESERESWYAASPSGGSPSLEQPNWVMLENPWSEFAA